LKFQKVSPVVSLGGSFVVLAGLTLVVLRTLTVEPAIREIMLTPPTLASVPLPLLVQRAEAGDATAQFEIAQALWSRLDTDPDPLKWLHKAALGGEPRAQMSLAVLYMEGDGVQQDPVQGYAWLLRAAAAGNADAVRLEPEVRRDLSADQLEKARALARS